MKPSTILLLVILLSGCNKYFKPVNTSVPSADLLEKNIRDGRTFFVRDNTFKYSMSDVKISAGRDTISGNVKRMSRDNASRGARKKVYYHYKSSIPKAVVQNHVYLFTDENLAGNNSERQIAISSLNKMHDLQFDQRKTTRSHVGTGVGIFVGVGLVAVFIGSLLTFSFVMGPV